MITIIGATGHTGRSAATHLLDAHALVRVIGRDTSTLAPFTARGADAVIGDIGEPDVLRRAFTGADAAYLMIPPRYDVADYLGRYEAIGAAFAEALADTGVRFAVLLSSLGGELTAGTGLVVGLHRVEEQLKAVPGLNLRILRPGYFYTNHLASIGLIAHQGINGGAEAPDVPVVTLDPDDVGRMAAEDLRTRNFTGVSVRELVGPRDLSPREATAILGAAIGKPDLPYVQFGDDDFVNALIRNAGFAPTVAALFLEMGKAFERGLVRPRDARTPANTGRRTLEQFAAETFAPAFRAS